MAVFHTRPITFHLFYIKYTTTGQSWATLGAELVTIGPDGASNNEADSRLVVNHYGKFTGSVSSQ